MERVRDSLVVTRSFRCPGGTQVGRLEIVPTVGGESPAAGENTLVTLSFKETNGHTVLTLQHDRLPRAQTDSHRSGWSEVLAKLSKEI